MGTPGSKSNLSRKNNKDDYNNSTSKDNKEDYSSNKWVQSETSESNKKSVSCVSSTSDKCERSEPTPSNEIKFPITFTWKEGGNSVLITGSFCGWNQFFMMTKTSKGFFEYVIPLPKGFHQYKFKVDGEWKYSTLHPIYNDNNNINNYIDMTKFPDQLEEKSKTNKIISNNNSSINSRNYTNYFPEKNELNMNAPPTPQNYLNCFNIDYNTKQHILGNAQYFNRPEQNMLSENNSFKSIAKPPHINAGHIYSKPEESENINAILSSCTTRMRNKYTTIIYYRPSINSIGEI